MDLSSGCSCSVSQAVTHSRSSERDDLDPPIVPSFSLSLSLFSERRNITRRPWCENDALPHIYRSIQRVTSSNPFFTSITLWSPRLSLMPTLLQIYPSSLSSTWFLSLSTTQLDAPPRLRAQHRGSEQRQERGEGGVSRGFSAPNSFKRQNSFFSTESFGAKLHPATKERKKTVQKNGRQRTHHLKSRPMEEAERRRMTSNDVCAENVL